MYRSVFKKEISRMVREANHRQTGIVCTIGMNNSADLLGELMENGMNIMRVNCSHGDHNHHQKSIDNLRKNISNTKDRQLKHVACLLDIRGPKIRTGLLEKKENQYSPGDKIRIKLVPTADIPNHKGTQETIFCDYLSFPKTIKIGGKILIDDGLMEVVCTGVGNNYIDVEVKNKAALCERKGVLIPGECIDLPAVSDKDKHDLLFAARNGFDFVAASFIRKADQVREVRSILKGYGGDGIQIISKIENQEGLDNIDSIIEESDGIMVARGDLGVELPPEDIFSAQKMIIHKCNIRAKPVITATQMLESMTNYPVPTRAECTDVANAILDGSDCVMLSGETAKGKYPGITVKTMARICRKAEEFVDYEADYVKLYEETSRPLVSGEMLAASAVKIAYEMQAKVIFVLTETGQTARFVAKYRPPIPIVCLTYNERVAKQITMSKGVFPWLLAEEDRNKSLDQILPEVYNECVNLKYIDAKSGPQLGITLYDKNMWDNVEEATNLKLQYF